MKDSTIARERRDFPSTESPDFLKTTVTGARMLRAHAMFGAVGLSRIEVRGDHGC